MPGAFMCTYKKGIFQHLILLAEGLESRQLFCRGEEFQGLPILGKTFGMVPPDNDIFYRILINDQKWAKTFNANEKLKQ
jgi:hypothetical protein